MRKVRCLVESSKEKQQELAERLVREASEETRLAKKIMERMTRMRRRFRPPSRKTIYKRL